MAQYQSFPDAAGASFTLDKLKALCLPDLSGKAFLDVGCNEGFFCGFASFQGASHAVGIDRSAMFIERARKRFPDCEFLCQGWDALPDRTFDVILLASALHYADDQPALIDSLVRRLAEDGVLIVEMGIYPSKKPVWHNVKRSIDERLFPSMPMLRRVLAGYAWKWMGPSVNQSGDPVSRHVFHISRRRPVAYLLMQPPGFGKSSIASRLFRKARVPVVSGDRKLSQAASGKLEVSAPLRALLEEEYSPYRLDHVVRLVFESGLGPELIQLWLDGLDAVDVALDVYVPAEYHASIQSMLVDRGYMPVQLGWQRVGPAPMPQSVIAQQAEAFYLSLANSEEADRPDGSSYRGRYAGHVDEIELDNGRLSIRGWAIDERGALPSRFSVRAARGVVEVDTFDRQIRPDVQRHLGLPHALVGYRLLVEIPGVRSAADLGPRFQVVADGRTALTLSGPVADIFRNGRK